MNRTDRPRPTLLVVGCLLVGVVVAGCGGGSSGASGLPTLGTTSAGTPAASPTTSSRWTADQQAVVDRIDTYYRVAEGISAGAPLDMAALRSVATSTWAQHLGEGAQALKGANQKIIPPAGGSRRTYVSVTVTGATAKTALCIDQSGTVITINGTPEPTTTSKPTGLSMRLDRVDGVWKVADVVAAKDVPC